MLQDLRFALRQLVKSPGFTTVSLLTLAFGIGLNTAMFSLVNSLLLRPLPFFQPDQLVALQRATPQNNAGAFSPADYLALRREEAGFGQFAGYSRTTVAVSGPEQNAQPVELLRASANFLEVLAAPPALGRSFRAEEERDGRHRVVLLSHAFWQTRFGGASDVIGKTLRLDAEPHEIIGVLPAAATERRPFDRVAVMRPLGLRDSDRTSRTTTWLNVLGRRSDQVNAVAGAAFIAGMGARLARDFPEENQGTRWLAKSLLASTVSDSGRRMLLMLLGLSGCVLLIACSNLANLLLARTLARFREFAVRSALGASRSQLLKPLALESLLLAIGGGLGALLIAQATTRWFATQLAASGEIPMDLSFDARVLTAALGTAALTLVLFGIAPALHLRRITPSDALKSAGRGSSATRGQQRFRQLLVGGQVALAMTLVAGGGYFAWGARQHAKQQFGSDSSAVLQASLSLPAARYTGPDRWRTFAQDSIERVQRLPGINSVSVSQALPYLGLPSARTFMIAGRDPAPKGAEPTARPNSVTPGFFATTGVRLLQGRNFTNADTDTAPRVVLISESFARLHFPARDALGARIARVANGVPAWAEIVGIVADVRSRDPGTTTGAFQIYQPFAQEPRASFTLAVRVENDAAVPGLIEPLRKTLAAMDPDLPVSELMPVPEAIDRSLSGFRLIEQLLQGFAALGLLLAGLGIYGVTARIVEQRTSEIGVRMALGAQVVDILRHILGGSLRTTLIGATLGALGSVAVARLLASSIPGLRPDAAFITAAAAVALILITLFAAYLPARRAAKIDPVVALRTE